MPLAKEDTRREINLVAVTRMIKVLADVGKDVGKAKARVIKVPEASLQAPRAVMLLRLRLSSIN